MALRHFLLAVAGAAAFSFPVDAQFSVPAYKDTAGQPRSSSGVVTLGGSAITAGQVSVGTTATLVAAASARQSIDVTVDGAVKCYLGPAGVTTTTGFPLQAVAGASKTIPSSAAIYAVCASTVTLGWMQHQ